MRLPSTYQFNQHILADTFYAKTSQGKSLAFLNIICDATEFQVVSCLGELTGTPSSGIVLRHFLTSWSSWAGLPHSLQVDRGKEYMAQFAARVAQIRMDSDSRVRRALLRKVHQQEDLFPSAPMCTSTAVSLNSHNTMAAPTTGMGLRESLDLNSATHAAQKTAIQPLMGQLPTAIGCDMGQASSWHLVNK